MLTFSIQEKTFNVLLVGVFFIAVIGMAAFNYSVNAFGVFPMKTIAGYNDVRFVENTRIYKTFLIKNHRIDGLLLGSSRIEESMRPLPAAWPNMQPYNMAMPGTSIHELLRNLQHANAITPLKQVLIGVDFFMFSAFMEPVSDFSENYFAVDEADKRKPSLYVLRTYANILLSSDALEKSVSTIKDSKKHITPSHEDNGMTSIAAHRAAVKDNAALYKVFDSFEKTYFRKNGFWLNGPNATFTTRGKDGHSTYDDFRALLDYVYRNNISVSFMIPPLHEYMLFGLDGIGLWPTYLQWKRDITAINEQVAAQYQQVPRPLIRALPHQKMVCTGFGIQHMCSHPLAMKFSSEFLSRTNKISAPHSPPPLLNNIYKNKHTYLHKLSKKMLIFVSTSNKNYNRSMCGNTFPPTITDRA